MHDDWHMMTGVFLMQSNWSDVKESLNRGHQCQTVHDGHRCKDLNGEDVKDRPILRWIAPDNFYTKNDFDLIMSLHVDN